MLLDRTATTKNISAREIYGQKTETTVRETRDINLNKLQEQMNEVPAELQSYLYKYHVNVNR